MRRTDGAQDGPQIWLFRFEGRGNGAPRGTHWAESGLASSQSAPCLLLLIDRECRLGRRLTNGRALLFAHVLRDGVLTSSV